MINEKPFGRKKKEFLTLSEDKLGRLKFHGHIQDQQTEAMTGTGKALTRTNPTIRETDLNAVS
jgi:hypothetical protein